MHSRLPVMSRPALYRANAVAEWLMFSLALAFTLFIFFRVQLLNGFTRLWGDRADGGIEASILEHWFNVFRGNSAWSQTHYFYPYKGTLGYNDGFFIDGMIYSVFRSTHIDPFVSSELTDIVIKAIGFSAFYFFVRRAFGCRVPAALLGATLFSIAHALYMHAFHQQLVTVAFAPLLASLIVGAYAQLAKGRLRHFVLFSCAGLVLYGAWLLTSFYMAWFFGFFALAMGVASFAFGFRFHRRVARLCAGAPAHAGAVAAIAALSVVPFLILYLPKARETGMHQWGVSLSYAPRLNDAINVGTDNYMFGQLYGFLCAYCSSDNYEIMMGIPPIMIFLYLCSAIWLLSRYDGPGSIFLKIGVLATILTWALLFRWGNASVWHLVWQVVPGAKGLRVISRYQIFLAFPICVALTVYLDDLFRRVPRNVAAILAFVLVFEQLGASPRLNDRAEELDRVAVATPPKECQSFFVGAAQGQEADSVFMGLYPHNVEAMLISEMMNISTINGFSSFLPPTWNFDYPFREDYLARVRSYAVAHNIKGLCQLDLRTKTWVPFSVQPE